MVETSTVFNFLKRSNEALIGISVISVLVVMVIPIPPFLLDLLLSFSITFSLIILLVSVFMVYVL